MGIWGRMKSGLYTKYFRITLQVVGSILPTYPTAIALKALFVMDTGRKGHSTCTTEDSSQYSTQMLKAFSLCILRIYFVRVRWGRFSLDVLSINNAFFKVNRRTLYNKSAYFLLDMLVQEYYYRGKYLSHIHAVTALYNIMFLKHGACSVSMLSEAWCL